MTTPNNNNDLQTARNAIIIEKANLMANRAPRHLIEDASQRLLNLELAYLKCRKA